MNRVEVFPESCGDGLLICYESIEMCAKKQYWGHAAYSSVRYGTLSQHQMSFLEVQKNDLCFCVK